MPDRAAGETATPADFELDDGDVERLIVAAGGRDDSLEEVFADLGMDAVCGLLVDEVTFRADVARVDLADRTLEVQLDIVHAGRRNRHVLAVSSGRQITARPGRGREIAVRFEYELADLARELFGPARERLATPCRSTSYSAPTRDPATGTLTAELLWAGHQAAAAVLSGIDSRAPDLGALAARYRSDKWGGLHWYVPQYEHHLRGRRDDPVRVLEIGVGGYGNTRAGGASLKMWRRYFHRGLIFGLDVFDKSAVDQPRVRTLVGSQNDPELLDAMAREHGPFDVIIDDGSHVNEDVRISFRSLFPHLRRGGLYVIEDLWTAYCPGFGGSDLPEAGTETSIGLLKSLIDALHYEDHPRATAGKLASTGSEIVGIHVYRNIGFVEKGINAQGGTPAWVPRTPRSS